MKLPFYITTLAVLAAILFAPSYAFSETKPSESQVPSPESRPSDYQLYLKSGDRNPKWNEYIQPGFSSFESGNLATAFVFLSRAYAQGCRDGLLLFKLGLYKESQKQYKEAAEMLAEAAQKIPQQYPDHSLAKGIHEHAGRVLYQADEYDKALPELEKALEVSPDNFMVLFMSGQILRLQKKYDEAKAMFEKALKVKAPEGLTPDPKLKVMSELMMLAFEQKDIDGCLLYVDQILAISPADPTALSYKQKVEQLKLKMKEREMIQKIVK